MTTVSDYTALLSGWSWAGENVTGTPAVVTYSFPVEVQPYLESESVVAGPAVDTWAPLTSSERQMVEQSLESWSAVAGVKFVEVAPGEGDLTFGKLDFNATTYDGSSGFAYFPSRSGDDTYSFSSLLTGDAFFNTRTGLSMSTVTHEIGHALGLKHPFDGDITLDPRLDVRTNTTMSYTGRGGEVPGELDIDAVRHIYGPADPARGTLLSYGWNEETGALKQVWGSKSSQIGGSSSRDSIDAGSGHDRVAGYLGDDTLNGGGGRDVLFGNGGNDMFRPGRGDDTAFGGDYHGDEAGGIDTVDYSGAREDISIELSGWWVGGTESAASGSDIGFDRLFDIEHFVTGAGDDTIVGNDWANRIRTNGGADSAFGGLGADVLEGGGGGDVLVGGAQRDTLDGGKGNDSLAGERGGDRLQGGKGTDTLAGGKGNDWLDGGKGTDILVGGDGNDSLQGGPGSDVFVYASRSDVVLDFAGDADTIRLNSRLWSGPMSVDEVFAAYASTDGATKSVFDFGGGDVLTIAGITDLDLLRSHVEIV